MGESVRYRIEPTGFLVHDGLGWASVHRRWRTYLPRRLPMTVFFHLDSFSGSESRLPLLRRHTWLRAALEGRRAAKAALNAGCRSICIFAMGHALFLPRDRRARYHIYGDSTPRQLDRLYYNEPWDSPRKRFFRRHVNKLARDGARFLCMSKWHLQGMSEEYEVAGGQASVFPPPVGADKWTPAPRKDDQQVKVLFLGADFERKGGDIVHDIALSGDLPNVSWHFVTRATGKSTGRIAFHNGLQPDSHDLIETVRSCHLLVLPTRADCYSFATIEANCCGLPAIITDVGGISDIVQDGVNGTLLPSADRELVSVAIRRYLDDPGLIACQGARARELAVERFEASKHADALAGILASA